MNVLLNAIDPEIGKYKISIDMTSYEVEQYTNETCILSHKTIEMKEFEVAHDFKYLHMLANGFDPKIFN